MTEHNVINRVDCATQVLCKGVKENTDFLPDGENIGDILLWNGSEWLPGDNVAELPDGENNDDILIWDGTTWNPGPNVSSNLPPGNATGDILVWNLSTQEWEAVDKNTGFGIPTGNTDNDALRWTQFQPANYLTWSAFLEFVKVTNSIELKHGNVAYSNITLSSVRWGDTHIIKINGTVDSEGIVSNTIDGNPGVLFPAQYIIDNIPTAIIRYPIFVEDDVGRQLAVLVLDHNNRTYHIEALTGSTFDGTSGSLTIDSSFNIYNRSVSIL